jgi:hypothetical protein
MSVNDTYAPRPKHFLADLVHAMGEAARTAQQATIDQCKSEAQAYTERLRTGTNAGAGALHKAAVADASQIRAQSRAAEERLRLETEERISRRHKRLEDELRECDSVIELEIRRVGALLQAFEADVDKVFEQLRQGTDPSSLITIATRMPSPPVYIDPDARALVNDLRQARTRATRIESLDRTRMDSGMGFAPRTHARPRSGQP